MQDQPTLQMVAVFAQDYSPGDMELVKLCIGLPGVESTYLMTRDPALLPVTLAANSGLEEFDAILAV